MVRLLNEDCMRSVRRSVIFRTVAILDGKSRSYITKSIVQEPFLRSESVCGMKAGRRHAVGNRGGDRPESCEKHCMNAQ